MNVIFFFSFLHIYTTFYHAGWIASSPMQDLLYQFLNKSFFGGGVYPFLPSSYPFTDVIV